MKQIQSPSGNSRFNGPALAAGFLVFMTIFQTVAFASLEDFAVARVNGIDLFRSDLNCAIETVVIHPGPTMEPEPPRKRVASERIEDEALQRLINIELLYQEGLKHRFPGIEEKVEMRYRSELARMGGEEKLSEALSCIDMTGQDLRKTIFRTLVISSFLEKVIYSRIAVSDEELEEFYENNRDRFRDPPSVRANQILVRVKSWSDTRDVREAESRAIMIHEEAVKGSDFIKLARKYSEDPSAGSTGGDMGIIYRGNLHKPLESIIFSLPDGGVSEPVRYRNGFLIFKVNSVHPPAYKSLDEVRGQCITKLRRSKAQEMIHDLLAELRSKATIEILDSDP